MRQIVTILFLSIIALGVSGCGGSPAEMAKDFGCNYEVKYERESGIIDDLGKIVGDTYPNWYTSFWGAQPDEYRSEWSRLILARNGLSSAEQVRSGGVYMIPARCSDLDPLKVK